MAGADKATLSGCSIPASFNRNVDHTYVISSCGLSWGCFGRRSGGSSVVSGSGSSIIAHCLSHPNETAGIKYLITGVCHQASNRILYPAGITVDGSHGYGASVMLYGIYGLGSWPQIVDCIGDAFGKIKKLGFDPGFVEKRSVMVNDSKPEDEGRVDFESSGIGDEFGRFVKQRLGNELSSEALGSLVKIQAELYENRRRACALVQSGLLTDEEFCEQLRLFLKEALSRSLYVLGERNFTVVFGAGSYDAEHLIDCDIFKRWREDTKP
jgi:hypothetical protein